MGEKDKAEAIRERQRRHRQKKRKTFVRVDEWVPEDRADEFRQIAKTMREHPGLRYQSAPEGQHVETYPLPLTRNAATTEWNRTMVKADKYQHPQDNTLIWSGRGRKPAWVEAWTAKGGTIDQLLKGEC